MNHLLIVDDDKTAVNALQTLLELDGYQVTALHSAPQALQELNARGASYDGVITDLEMPGAHGVEVVDAALRAHPGVPVLIVTAYARSPACSRAMQMGARRVFAKPLAYEELERELKTCIGVTS